MFRGGVEHGSTFKRVLWGYVVGGLFGIGAIFSIG